MLLTELYHEQSSRWPQIAQAHLAIVHENVSQFISRGLSHVVKEESTRLHLQQIVHSSLEAKLEAASLELKEPCEDEKMHLITYNHYYTDNI